MPALVAGSHVFIAWGKVVDGRNKSGHDARAAAFPPPNLLWAIMHFANTSGK